METGSQSSSADLSDDLIMEILTLLPPESIVRFRCVSKSWCDLIDLNFLKLLVTKKEPVNHQDYSVELKSLIESDEDAVDYMYPFQNPCGDGSIEIVGSCNGLICACHAGCVFYVWNPYTAEYKVILSMESPLGFLTKDSNRRMGYGCSDTNIGYGFGYDSKSCSYKFVSIFSEPDTDLSEVQMYRLGSGLWKSFDSCIAYQFSREEPGVFLDGALHWLVSSHMGNDESQPRVLISMDMEDGVFKEIAQPEHMDDFDYTFVGGLRGCLCLLCSVSNAKFEIWQMKDYGVGESWSKVFKTDYPELMTMGIRSFRYIRRLVSLRNGEIFFEACDQHGVVDVVRTHLDEKERCQNSGGGYKYMKNILQMEAYVASLVSVKSGTFVGDELKNYPRRLRRPG